MITVDPYHVGPWVCEKAGGTWHPNRGSAIGLIKDGDLVAGVLYEDWNGANLMCHIRGEKGWADRKFLRIMFDYPFNQIGAKRLTAPISSTNKRAIEFVQRLGFVLECVLAQATPDGDMHIYRIFREDCKYL